MNDENKSEQNLEIKALLSEWKLPQLLHHFVAQKITIEILKMMKLHHINDVLYGFTFGDRIRFEYELEKWRRKIGIPLENKDYMPSISCNTLPSPIEKQNKIFENYNEKQKILEPPKIMTATKAAEPILPKSPIPPPITIVNPIPITIPTTFSIKTAPTPTIPQPSIYTKPQPSFHLKKSSPLKFSPPKELIAAPKSLDVHSILMQCIPRGPQLLKIYETRQSFTTVERSELINLFAGFFHRNLIHLSLKMSYELERQILKIFPSERLKDYRREKRGRIYIRLCNIKNFKQRTKRAKERNNFNQEQYVITNVDDSQEHEEQQNFIIDENDKIMNEETNSHDVLTSDEIKTEVGDTDTDMVHVNHGYYE